MNQLSHDENFQHMYRRIRDVLTHARYRTWRAVNFEIVVAYWEIGQLIVECEQRGPARAGYGEYLIKELAEPLTNNFGKCFTATNLKYFRLFYLSFTIGHAVRD